MKRDGQYYIVHKKILPDVIKKTVEVNELLQQNEKMTINDAVNLIGISRSAYYKYKDYITPFYHMDKEKMVTLSFILAHKQGVLMRVLKDISDMSANIITINQGIPLQGYANVSISLETGNLDIDIEEMIDELSRIDGVKKVELTAQNI